MKRTLLIFICLSFLSKGQVIYNAYAKVTNISGSTFTVSNLTEPASYSFTAGEQIIVMQMQDNIIGTNTTNISSFGDISSIQSAGLWEVKTISSINRSGATATVVLTSSLVNSYNTGANSSLQIISFKNLNTAAFTTSANITCTAWNGNIGGVLAIEVGTDLILQHSISSSTLGFLGGTVSIDHSGATCSAPSTTVYAFNDSRLGYKGEGIYKNTDVNYANARGKIANGGGGGNHHNGGGGGGGNWSAGGLGGNGFNNCTTNPGGGLGGLSLSTYIPFNRIYMGGGGGGGQRNNTTGSRGGNGGGIVILKSNRIITGTTCVGGIRITANGETAASGGNDGQGGGGAAGTIILQVGTFSLSATCPLTISANGGNGGTSSNGSPHAGGGGGAQGVVVFSIAQPTTNILVTANNGTPGCNNNSSPCTNIAGSATGTNGGGIMSPIGGFLPIELTEFKAQKQGNHVHLTWKTSSEINNNFFTIEKSKDAVIYSEIEFVKSKAKHGNSKTSIKYETKDYSPYTGTSYYRLKQTDLNAASKTFPIVSVNHEDITTINVRVYPNPNSGEFTVDFDGVNKNSELEINLTDISGKIIYKKHFQAGFEQNSIGLIPNEKLSAGIYICNLISEGVKFPVKVVVQ